MNIYRRMDRPNTPTLHKRSTRSTSCKRISQTMIRWMVRSISRAIARGKWAKTRRRATHSYSSLPPIPTIPARPKYSRASANTTFQNRKMPSWGSKAKSCGAKRSNTIPRPSKWAKTQRYTTEHSTAKHGPNIIPKITTA